VKYSLTIILLTGVLSCQLGCDLFTTRDPEPPSTSTSTFLQPVSADLVLENLKNAIAQGNADNYFRCFIDPSLSDRAYTFVPSVEISAQYASVFAAWTPENERQYFQNLGAPLNGTPYLTLSSSRTLAVSSDSVVYSMEYTLYYPHRRSGVTAYVQGNMLLYLGTNEQRNWAIYRWQDNKTVSDSTWSYWKALFSGS